MTPYTAKLSAVALMGVLSASGPAFAQERRTKAKPPPAPVAKPVPEAADAPLSMERIAKDVGRSTRSRYMFVVGGVLMATGMGFGYWAQGEVKRAETMRAAYDSQRAVEAARQSASTANVFFALAVATFAYGVALELLPQPIAERASLTFHF